MVQFNWFLNTAQEHLPHKKSFILLVATTFTFKPWMVTSVTAPVSFWAAPGIFFAGSGSSSYKKYQVAIQPLKHFFQHPIFLTRKISFIFKY